MASLETISHVLEQLLLPQHARLAEQELLAMETTPGFAVSLLHVVSLTNLNALVRLAGALFFKNLIKRKWLSSDGETYMLPLEDVTKIKQEIVDVLVQLPSQLQRQIGEAITLIAECDFPHRWENLIDLLVAKLSPTDFVNNRAVLEVMHSIFKKWRPLFRSDELFLEIKLVLEKFAPTFLQLFVAVDQLIGEHKDDAASLGIYLDNLLVLVQLYYDLNCQELPEFFEDNMRQLMKLIYDYLKFQSNLITKPDEDLEVDVLIKVKTAIVELLSLYVNRYADDFSEYVEEFIKLVWETVSGVLEQPKYDLLAVKLLDFLSSVVRNPGLQHIFNNEQAFDEIIRKLILPNIVFRELDEEQFEDEPIQFVRSDLEGSEFESRRKSATDFLRELKEVNSQLITTKVMSYVNDFLSQLKDNWKNKDIAIYLFTSLATKGSITNAGVTTVVIDVVGFFVQNIVGDLSNNQIHPILRMDAIKYIYVFRNQLTKEQLAEAINMMVNLLDVGQPPAVYTYAAVTLEKLLGLTDFKTHQPIFNKEDMRQIHPQLLTQLFLLLLQFQDRPERLDENEFVMKCIMRVLSVTDDTLENRMPIMGQLIFILEVTSKNPANPRFTHYVFELMGLLIKYAPESDIPTFVENLVPKLLPVLVEDIQEFVPYIFQILAYVLERLPKSQGLPTVYRDLVRPLMAPVIWEYKGNIPGITRLLIAIIQQDPSVCGDRDNLESVLGVFQKLISSKLNDAYGFDLLQTILLYVSPQHYMLFLRDVCFLLLNRLLNSRTERYVKRFTMFLMVLAATPLSQADIPNKQTINGSFVVQFFQNAQQDVFNKICKTFIIPTVLQLANLQDKKIANIGLSQLILAPELNDEVVLELTQLVADNILTYEGIKKQNDSGAKEPGVAMTNAPLNELDLEMQAFGLTFSKIVLVQNKSFDPVAHVPNNDFAGIERIVFTNIKQVRPAVAQALLPEVKERVLRLG